ncbi:MAG: MerR family transcriptional regulator [Myxococcota bacterium]|jgi:DNA-binding transcriptional MerR regulator|nr:MerR family transcriptional regulator [Myxococcota bacterium]
MGSRKRGSNRSGKPSAGSSEEYAPGSDEARVASLIPPGLIPESGKRYYRIGEVSKVTGVKPYVLRYWESEFRWMAPQKSRSKQRLYRRKDIEMILLIRQLLHEQRFTIAGARKHLRDLGIGGAIAEAAEESAREAAASAANPVFSTGDSIEAFRAIRSELLAIRQMLQ